MLQVFTDQQCSMQATLAKQTTALQTFRLPQPPAPAPFDQFPQPQSAPVAPTVMPVAYDTCLAPPKRFVGDAQQCRGFLASCLLQFELQPSRFPTKPSRVSITIYLMSGGAWDCARVEWLHQSSCCSTFKAFSAETRKVFDHMSSPHDIARRLFTSRYAMDYSVEFQTRAAESGRDPGALL